MNRILAIAFLFAASAALCAQTTPSGSTPQQKPQQAPSAANPFPTDTNDVPLLPSGAIAPAPDAAASPVPAPIQDSDPVRSPDGDLSAGNALAGQSQNFSSSESSLDNILPKPGVDDTASGNKKTKDDALQGPPKETAKEDINVGSYYMDNHDWRGALSRFQSAMVLSPDDPDVYWGLAECNRHLGNFAAARAAYIKVAEYDPDSRHGKDARKALKDPEIANAHNPPAPAAPRQ